MNEQLERMLLAADDAEQLECPADFDRHGSISRFNEIRPLVENILARKLEMDDQVQDATHFASLSITQLIVGNPNHRREVFSIYFSCFGALAAIWNEDVVADADIQLILNVLKSRGFIVVDSAQLQEPYTGSHRGFVGRTWGDRFFNYI